MLKNILFGIVEKIGIKSEYLNKEEIDTCKENIKFISENATLMTRQELEEFINYDYEIK